MSRMVAPDATVTCSKRHWVTPSFVLGRVLLEGLRKSALVKPQFPGAVNVLPERAPGHVPGQHSVRAHVPRSIPQQHEPRCHFLRLKVLCPDGVWSRRVPELSQHFVPRVYLATGSHLTEFRMEQFPEPLRIRSDLWLKKAPFKSLQRDEQRRITHAIYRMS